MMNQPGTTRGPSWLRLVLLPGLLIGLLIVTGGLVPRAHAQTTLTVTNCSSDSQLQADVNTANSDNANDTITFACSGDIKLTGTLIIGRSMTLSGSGQSVTLDGQNYRQVLAVKSGASFTLNALTIADGFSDFGSGGLFNQFGGTVTITNSTFVGNTATAAGNGGVGGGLYNQGTVSISNSTFADNTAGVPGNGTGGGLYNDQGTVSISNSTFVLNRAGAAGGGLNNAGGTVSISSSTFTINISPDGGGLFNCCGGTVSISNSTFTNNRAEAGGGLYNAGGTTSIGTSTFAYNLAGYNGGGLLNENGSTVSIGGSIVANNFNGNCSGVVSDQGYNLESGTDCGLTGTGDLQNTDPQLDPQRLQNNGGPTQTIALLSSSPAIDRIPAASCPATDQRGFTRPDDASEGACDMGAYESNYDDDLGLTNVPATITTDATSPQGAVVTYTPPTATDESGDTTTALVNCTPVSGSTFAIGTTTVTCTATDSDDVNSPVSQSFTVAVKGAADQVSDLISTVNSFGLPAGPQASFDTQLQAVQTDLTNNNTTQACSDLTAFINHVQAQSGKQLTLSQANQLIAAARQVQAVLGC